MESVTEKLTDYFRYRNSFKYHKRKIIGILFSALIAILIIYVIKPSYYSYNNAKYIKNPVAKDLYLINRNKLDKTKYALPWDTSNSRGHQIFEVKEVTKSNLVLWGGSIHYGNSYGGGYEYPIRVITEESKAFKQDYFKQKNTLILPRKEIMKLNIFRCIVFVHRNINAEQNAPHGLAEARR